jgi:hypothetical protein
MKACFTILLYRHSSMTLFKVFAKRLDYSTFLYKENTFRYKEMPIYPLPARISMIGCS